MNNNDTKTIKPEPPVSPLLDKAQSLYSTGAYEETITEAMPHIASTDPVLATDARRLTALCLFQLMRYAEAEKNFEIIVTTSQAPSDWFNVCTSATMAGHIERGKEAFDKGLGLYKKVEGQVPGAIVNAIYYYMRALIDVKEYDRAFEQLEKLKGFYAGSPVTDYTYMVASAGAVIPSLQNLMEAIKPILEHMGAEKADAWRKSFSTLMDEEGKATVLGNR